MAEIWIGAAATVVVGAYAADQQGDAAEDQANAIQAGTDASLAENRRQFNITQQNLAPWLRAGGDALDRQRAFLDGDMTGFQDSAQYQFAVDQGFRGLNRGLGATGNASPGGFGGRADADRIAFGQGLATQYADNYWNKLAGLSNTGNATAGQLGQFGASMAGNNANLLMGNAGARASAYQQRADANSQLAGLVGGAFNNGMQQWQAQRTQQAPARGGVGNWGAY